jgi:hypothetical protein
MLKKSRPTAIILALLLGPLGLCYASVLGGVIMFVLALVTLPMAPVSTVVVWLLCVLIADSAAHGHNKRVDEWLKAMKQ